MLALTRVPCGSCCGGVVAMLWLRQQASSITHGNAFIPLLALTPVVRTATITATTAAAPIAGGGGEGAAARVLLRSEYNPVGQIHR